MKRLHTFSSPFFSGNLPPGIPVFWLGLYLLAGQSFAGLYRPVFHESFALSDSGKISWTTAAPQPVANSEAQAVVVADKLYVFGGFDLLKSTFTPTDRAYVFDSKANTWTPIRNMPAMNGTGYGGVTHSGFTTDGKDIYFAGGYTANSTGGGQIFGTAEVWKYSVAGNTYSRLPNLPMALSAGTLEYLGGKLHWIGGSNKARTEDLGVHYVLDLSNTAKGWISAAPLPNPRHHLGSAVYKGKIYVFGGQHGHDSKLVTQDDAHVYDLATNQWQQLTDMPRARGHISGATFAWGERIFVLGGETAHGSHIRDVTAYQPGSDSWVKFTDLPAARSSGVAGVLGGAIYYSSGSRSKTTYKGVLEEQPAPVAEALWLEAECATRLGANWKTLSDPAASAGSYVSIKNGLVSYNTPPTTPENIASFDFNITQAGTYHLLARVKAPTIEDNSFWIRIDGGSWLKWSIDALTYDAFDWRAVRNSPFTFGSAGMHTIDVSYREDGTLLDKFYLGTSGTTPTGQGQTASNCTQKEPDHWLEAECSPAIGANWVTASHADASGGAYVAVRNGLNTGSTPPTGSADRVSFTFDIAEANAYQIFARVKAPNDQSNSFWVRIDGGQWLKWHISLTRDVFDWRMVRDASFTFSTGIHTLDFAYREDGTLLDKLYITATGTQPNGLGVAVASCASSSTASTEKAVIENAFEEVAYPTDTPSLQLSIFPNPSDALFHVTLPGVKFNSGWVTVWTLQGKMVKKVKIEDTSLPLTIDLSGIETGIYVLRTTTPNGTVTRRITKW